MSGTAPVVVTYLERQCGVADRTGVAPVPFALRREFAPTAARVASALYIRVGNPWRWTDRLPWSESDWDAAIHCDDVELWTAWIAEEIAGYFELHAEAESVELKYFGLLPEFTGRGLGRALLTAAIDRAGALGKRCVTVNTCTLDHPAALGNYLKQGFRVVRTETRDPAVGP